MATIHLVIGPVGAGKSTTAQHLAAKHSAVVINLDDWMATLFSADRPSDNVIAWYVERTDRCLAQIWKMTAGIVEAGTDVVLEIGLIQRSARAWLYERVDTGGFSLTVSVVDAPRDVRRQRVIRRNEERGATFSMVVPLPIFERASDLWEPPDDDECRSRDIRFL